MSSETRPSAARVAARRLGWSGGLIGGLITARLGLGLSDALSLVIIIVALWFIGEMAFEAWGQSPDRESLRRREAALAQRRGASR